MSKKNILLAITNGLWLIDELSAQQLGLQVSNLLSGDKFWSEEKKASPEMLIVGAGETPDSYYGSNSSSAKPASVAVLTISGPIMKDDNCGDPGTKSFINMLDNLNSNPNITGVVLVFDSPGGTVAGTQAFSDAIKNFSKPIVTLAEDLMASAAYWAGSSADFIFANNTTTRIGSIGTMLSFADMQPYWEKQGVKFHEIYATASSRKNQDFAQARKGNYEAIIAGTLNPLNDQFLAAVIENRGSKLDQSKTLDGTVYLAADALKHGLIDAIGNLQDAINKVQELAGAANNSTQNSQQTNMKKVTLTAAHAALIAMCGATIAAGQDSVDVDIDAVNTAAAKMASDLKAATDSIAAMKTDADKAKGDLDAATAATKLAQDELAAYKVSNPGSTTTEKVGQDKIDAGMSAADKEVWELPHNKAALENPIFG